MNFTLKKYRRESGIAPFDKKTQRHDIAEAKKLWAEYLIGVGFQQLAKDTGIGAPSLHRALSRRGNPTEHNQEFALGRVPVGCYGRATLILKLLRRRNCIGIGFYVCQKRELMRLKLKKKLADWHQDGLRIAYEGTTSSTGDQGFALYAYIDDVSPREIEDGAVDLDCTLKRVCEKVAAVAELLKEFANFSGAWMRHESI